MTIPIVSKILVAEDHELFSDGIVSLLRDVFTEAEIVSAYDFDSAWQILNQNEVFDLILMDLVMPGTKGFNGIRALKKAFPTQAIAVFSSLDTSANINQVMSLGVNAFISKSTPKQKLITTLCAILDGEICIESPNYHLPCAKLTARQLQTLHLIAEGKSNKEIAKALKISPNTVKEYVSHVIKALKADNRSHAVLLAYEQGLLFDNHH